MLLQFLRERGFTELSDERRGHSQLVSGLSAAGDRIGMSVRLCWRMDAGRAAKARRGADFAAAQILARVDRGQFVAALTDKVKREHRKGATHFLIVRRDGEEIQSAALIPLDVIVDVWSKQRAIFEFLTTSGRLQGRRKNPSENGVSPTIFLHDDLAPEVGAALWTYPGVVDLATLPTQRLTIAPSDALSEEYSPSGLDTRSRALREILLRRGQESFRNALRSRFADQCVITGCSLLSVLEAAHIIPYRGADENNVQNGLLLRADIHTLFDLNLIGINPATLCVEVHAEALQDYSALEGVHLRVPAGNEPSVRALELRYREFLATASFSFTGCSTSGPKEK